MRENRFHPDSQSEKVKQTERVNIQEAEHKACAAAPSLCVPVSSLYPGSGRSK